MVRPAGRCEVPGRAPGRAARPTPQLGPRPARRLHRPPDLPRRGHTRR
ncbi:hypothetical protein [Actinophytocola sp.]|nr:hypothetical protein [Actinophytocola sp.]HET9138569.1 hypothetical protein [Actinophytocola sp.]